MQPVNPLTVIGLTILSLALNPPGLEVTVYLVIGLPPSEAGGVKLTSTLPLPV